MARYKPSELRAYLDSLGVRPKKGLSQNFLIDGNIVRKIVDAADVQPGDTVVEIGPGPGAVSEEIVNRGAQLIAIEKDTILADALRSLPNTTVYNNDVLEVDFDNILSGKVKVITNLPYHISTPIITKLTPRHDLFSIIIVMVQHELAVRMTAPANHTDYGSLTTFLQFYSDTTLAFRVSRNCFYPAPNVDSAIVAIRPKTPPVVDETLFFLITRTAFGQRRKTLRTSLKKLFPTISELLEKAGLSPNARPQEIGLQGFLDLYYVIANQQLK